MATYGPPPTPPSTPELLAMLRAGVENSPNALMLTDARGRVVYSNPAADQILGGALVGLERLPPGVQIAEASSPPVRDTRELLVSRALVGEAVPEQEMTLTRAEGTRVHVRCVARPVRGPGGEVVGAVFIGRDVTEQVKTEEALRHAYRSMEEQVRLRTEELARANDELKREIERRRAVGQGLRASEELYRSLAEAAHDMIFIIGADDRVEYVNSFGASQFGKAADELIGLPRSTLFPPNVSHGQRVNIERALQTGQPIYAQTLSAFPGGERWLGTWLTPIRFKDGKPQAVLGLARDITERIRAEERLRHSEERFKSLFGAVSAGVLVYDRDGRVIDGNARAFAILRTGLDYMRSLEPGHTAGSPTDEEGRPMAWTDYPIVQALRTGEVVRDRVLGLSPGSGERVWLHITAAPLVDPRTGEVTGALATFLDISDRKRDEQFRNEYLSLISHDLRNPLAALAGRADLLARNLGKKGLEAEERMAEGIVGGTRRLTAMFQNLVDAARLEAGRLPLQRRLLELGPWLTEVIDHALAEDEVQRVRLNCGPVPAVNVDPSQLERAVVNLVSNALKYSPPDSPVSVQLTREERWAVVEVTDLGDGIGPEDVPKIFQRFFRAHGRSAPGLGLGLYIARLAVESHGGSIAVSSRPGQGSAFTIRLPLE